MIPQKQNLGELLISKKESKFKSIKKLGPQAYKDLKKIAFAESELLTKRWRAFMAMVRIGEFEAMPEIKQALSSKDWFLRDAAIRVLPVLNRDVAYSEALKALNDPALVVRTSAVICLKELARAESAPKLWQALYSRENYLKQQSLWIRRNIVEALAEIAPAGSEGHFIKILDDEDSSLAEPAIRGLERVSGLSFGTENQSANSKKYYWKKWYQSKSEKT